VITHPEKIMFPEDGITKGELAAYYEAVAPLLLPHVRGRPVTMERYPQGIAAKGFIQKDVSKGFPDWLERVEVPKKGGTVHHPLIMDTQSLLWVANQNCITPHVGISRLPELNTPDLCVFDLDPTRDEPAVLRDTALALRALLEELGLTSWVKTSGSKGFHIVVPLAAETHGVAAVLVNRDPDHLTQEFIKTDRQGRILIDTGRNGFGATFAAAYAVRPKPGAPVSAPCTWQELQSGAIAPRTFTLRTMADRVAAVGELWADLPTSKQSLVEPLTRLQSQLSEQDWDEARAASSRKPVARKRGPTR
jgi:bifunctional non-homologous end joining protein LigD